MSAQAYLGRFAPTPSGPLHMGSIAAALACALDARAQHGTWLLRFDDLDTPRNQTGAVQHIAQTLRALGLHWQGEPIFQSQRTALYSAALAQLSPFTYACECSRKQVAEQGVFNPESNENIYSGRCKNLQKIFTLGKNSLRIQIEKIAAQNIAFCDRACGHITQNLATEVGDFVLQRADKFFSYHLANVVDDAALGISHIVRGADLLPSTVRQLALAGALHYPKLTYLHIPVVMGADGQKLSKQNLAPAVETHTPLATLRQAAQHLGLGEIYGNEREDFFNQATLAWANKYPLNCPHN
jgi:glutamyl-Q tRNA(Asp) synthetase